MIIYFSICMIGKNMTNNSLGTPRMNKTLLLTACFFIIFASAGCRGTIMEPAPDDFVCTDGNCSSGSEFTTSEFESNDGNEFVNYTKVAADYREYGERTPRDQNITQAAAGNNLSAAIPPSIEDEVVDYEEEIKVTENNNGSSDEAGMAAGEDPVEDWLAEEGKTLKSLLTEWSERSGWRLVWNSNRNYTLTAGAMFRGRFADVSSALIRAFARARPAPIATFYKGNRVLVVETMEDENAY